MKLKKTLVTLTIILFLSSITACSSNQAVPAKESTNTQVSSNSKNTTDQEASGESNTTNTTAELPQPVIVRQSRGASQSTGARIAVYIVKVAVSAAVTYFVTKAIIDYVKKDVTGED